jgi:hypothetical protein
MTKYCRASGFTEQIGEPICELLCQGRSVLGIARMRGIRRDQHPTVGWNTRLSGV